MSATGRYLFDGKRKSVCQNKIIFGKWNSFIFFSVLSMDNKYEFMTIQQLKISKWPNKKFTKLFMTSFFSWFLLIRQQTHSWSLDFLKQCCFGLTIFAHNVRLILSSCGIASYFFKTFPYTHTQSTLLYGYIICIWWKSRLNDKHEILYCKSLPSSIKICICWCNFYDNFYSN